MEWEGRDKARLGRADEEGSGFKEGSVVETSFTRLEAMGRAERGGRITASERTGEGP